ncbi:unnamed protein product [Urochloa humidicola]
MDGSDSDENASPMDDEPPLPEPVLPDAEGEGSSTEPCPYRDIVEFYRALMHFHLRRLSASRRRFPMLRRRHELPGGDVLVMVGIVRDGILTWYVDGQPVADDDAYVNGGFGGVPASEEAMAALPKTTVVGEGKSEERGIECAVCLEAYETGNTIRTMPCSHGFHESCIFQWLRVSRLCPLCRFALPAAEDEDTESFVDEEDDIDGDTDGDDDILESIQFLYL